MRVPLGFDEASRFRFHSFLRRSRFKLLVFVSVEKGKQTYQELFTLLYACLQLRHHLHNMYKHLRTNPMLTTLLTLNFQVALVDRSTATTLWPSFQHNKWRGTEQDVNAWLPDRQWRKTSASFFFTVPVISGFSCQLWCVWGQNYIAELHRVKTFKLQCFAVSNLEALWMNILGKQLCQLANRIHNS